MTVTRTAGASSLTCDNLAGWPTVSKVHFVTYKIDTNNAKIAGSQIDWQGIVSGNSIGSMTRLAGATDAGNAIGDVVEMMPTGSWGHDLYGWGTAQHNTDGTHAAVTATSVSTTGGVTVGGNLTVTGTTSSPLATSVANGWNALSAAPSTITYNGNRSYTCVFNGTDLTGTLSQGMRLRTTRTVAAPTQCTSLNGTTQFYSKTSPAGMTFTDTCSLSVWIKPASYTNSIIMSRYNGTSGWYLHFNASGQIEFVGLNGGAGNYRNITSYQSVPLNKWTHVFVSFQMSDHTSTTCKIAFDGVDVPATISSAGTNPTSLVQAGNLEIGSYNGGTLNFPGKIAQAAIFSAVISEATNLTYISQGLAGTETSLISAYSFNNSINDLSSNANNLTANGSAVATNSDSPFTQQAGGTPNGSNDYAIIQSASFSTNTTLVVQVPEGNTIPTSGGVSAVSYATVKAPYGMPATEGKWTIGTWFVGTQSSTPTNNVWYQPQQISLNIPVGDFIVGYQVGARGAASASSFVNTAVTLSTTTNSETDTELTGYAGSDQNAAGTATLLTLFNRSKQLSLAAATSYYLLHRMGTGSGVLSSNGFSSTGLNVVTAKPAHL